MCVGCSILYTATGTGLLLANSGASLAVTSAQDIPRTITSQVQGLQDLPTALEAIKAPSLEDPGWLKEQNAAEVAARNAARSVPISKVVTYDVTSKGTITASMSEFRTQANATLNDTRGWARLGVSFQEVASGGTFTLVLSEASQMTTFSSGCGTEYSCRVGRNVIINQDRWLGATGSWNQAGGSLRDYRHMVVNHETGHWLGHDHAACGGAGQSAPVMQQQSINLQGCGFNPWPLASELWSTQLGIRKS
jgi:hypothetical protein